MQDEIYIVKGEDRTEALQSVTQLDNGEYEVLFKSKSTAYTYGQGNIIIERLRRQLDPKEFLVLIDEVVEKNVQAIGAYESYVKLLYKNGRTKTTARGRVQFIGSSLDDERSKTIFDYFKTIAHEVSLKTDDGKNILGDHYEKIDFVRDDTVLASYLRGALLSASEDPPSCRTIYPFGFNWSQKQAVDNALQSPLSVIHGPPGTGKTQTILNIIANLVRQGKTIAVISNNNSAIDNVYEKLQEQDIAFLAARLGSVSNKRQFIETQAAPLVDDLAAWSMTRTKISEADARIEALGEEMRDVLEQKNSLARRKKELEELKTEQEYFFTHQSGQSEIPPTFWRRVSSGSLLDLWREVEVKAPLNFLRKALLIIRYGLWPTEFFGQPLQDRIVVIQKYYYQQKQDELITEITQLQNSIERRRLDDTTKAHSELSARVFKASVFQRVAKNPIKHYSLYDLQRRSDEFTNDYPIVLSTAYSLHGCLEKGYVFDYVIVDEASQVDLATFALAMSCAKNAVIVGDSKQLPNVVTDPIQQKDTEIFRKNAIPNDYQFSVHSALSSITSLFGDTIPNQLLREHYRCHPKIIEFCNTMFYDGQLIVHTKEEPMDHDPLKVYATVMGNHARSDHINQRQIDVTLHEVLPREGLDTMGENVGIVTPYRNHARKLNEVLKGTNVVAATVDKFQGREKDAIIINTVDNKISDFASNPNRLNVAVSRARKQLIVVTNGNDNSVGTGIDELVNYIKYHNFEVIASEVRSIFDVLYRTYRTRAIQKSKWSASPAEDLMNELLQKVLHRRGLTNLATIPQYPLRLLCDTSLLEGRERQYAENHHTRVDFIIFQKASKRPVLAIEVDGHSYHKPGGRQYERDAMKNAVLDRFAIPYIRFSTTGSDEEARLSEALQKAVAS